MNATVIHDKLSSATQLLMNEQNTSFDRFDLYRQAHKGIRLCMFDVLSQVGYLDCQDGEQVREVMEKVRGLLLLCRRHLQHENRFIHTAMEARAPGSSYDCAREHATHELDCDRIERLVHQVEQAQGAARITANHNLYQWLSAFIADNLQHMLIEEIHNNALLWQSYSDTELQQLHQQIVAAIPPEQSLVFLRWLLPSVSPEERAVLLRNLRKSAPAAFYDAVLAVIRSHLSMQDWQKLTQALA